SVRTGHGTVAGQTGPRPRHVRRVRGGARPSCARRDLARFTGAAVIAELTLRFGRDGADADLFAAAATALDDLAVAGGDAREAALAGAWRIIAALGFAPGVDVCV